MSIFSDDKETSEGFRADLPKNLYKTVC